MTKAIDTRWGATLFLLILVSGVPAGAQAASSFEQLLGLLGATAGLGLATGWRAGASAQQSIRFTSADSPSFPSGPSSAPCGETWIPNGWPTGRR